MCPCLLQYNEWCSDVLWVDLVLQQNTRAHTGEGDGGRGEDDSKEVEDFYEPVPRGLLT